MWAGWVVVAVDEFWSSDAGQALALAGEFAIWLAAIVAGIAALIKLWQWGKKTRHWGVMRLRERARVDAALEELTSGDWPNSAETLKQSHNVLYNKFTDVDGRLTAVEKNVAKLPVMETQLGDIQKAVELLLEDRRSA